MSQQLNLTVRNGPLAGYIFQLDAGSYTIGRTPDNSIHLSEPTISKQHARIIIKENQFFIQDLSSSNGTFVNGQRITGPVAFVPGDIIQVGTSVILEVRGPGGVAVPVQASAAYPTPAAKSSKGSVRVLMALAILIVLVGLGIGTWFVLQGGLSSETAAPATTEPTATPLSTATPTATSVPAVLIEMSVDQTMVQLGRCVTLRWQVENAKEVRLDGEKVVDEGTHKVCPQEASRTYRITAVSLDGETSEETVTLTVPPTPPPPPGVDIEFVADKTTVTYGDCATLRWSVKNAKEVRRETKKVGLIGSEQVCPTDAANTYNLLVQTLEGENVEQTVTIVVPPTPVPTHTSLPPTATPKPQAQNPVIDKFIADQNSLNQGSCTTLRWQVRNAQTVRLDGTQVANQGSQRVCPTAASANTYNLVATGTGGSVQSSLTISVAAPTPTPVIIIVQPTPVQPAAPAPSGPPFVDAWVTMENDCVVYGWSTNNIKEVYFDGEGVTGHGTKKDWCFGDDDDDDDGDVNDPTLRVIHLDGRVEEIFISDAPGSPFWR